MHVCCLHLFSTVPHLHFIIIGSYLQDVGITIFDVAAFYIIYLIVALPLKLIRNSGLLCLKMSRAGEQHNRILNL